MRDVRRPIRSRFDDAESSGGTLQRASQRPSIGHADELRSAEPGGAFEIEPVRGGEQLLEPIGVLRDGQELEDASAVFVDAEDCEGKAQPGGSDQPAQVVEQREIGRASCRERV